MSASLGTYFAEMDQKTTGGETGEDAGVHEEHFIPSDERQKPEHQPNEVRKHREKEHQPKELAHFASRGTQGDEHRWAERVQSAKEKRKEKPIGIAAGKHPDDQQ